MGNDKKQAYNKKYYNLDMIISLGYRIKSKVATNFRRWATTKRYKESFINIKKELGNYKLYHIFLINHC
jgi:hypothetical protein